MKSIGDGIVTVVVAIIGLATLAVIFGKQSETASVIKDFGKIFNGAIKTIVSPVR